MNEETTILKTTDWVKGTSIKGEMVIGFIDSLSMVQGAVYVTVANSDNDAIVGLTIPLAVQQVESLPLTAPKDTVQLEYLIDLALQTGDKEWFEELTGELNGKGKKLNEII
ncbi:IDEAL domain-containing protein [Planomicrobium sp. MB-3u-38]|uniref:IDEAL domain-containing protein n=1 Tax=Planomicrobium sp. MB-3u-38 TaxID=2058318 RepID=UPI000C7CABE5|nr:IDEAL domain-containing protein [Planomicrobium sp. MB-3u-38]PKH10106.1 group-specific protein [Planomicrobium sp. MB-3u-38]